MFLWRDKYIMDHQCY